MQTCGLVLRADTTLSTPTGTGGGQVSADAGPSGNEREASAEGDRGLLNGWRGDASAQNGGA